MIKRAHGEPTITDAQIKSSMETYNTHGNRDSSIERLKAFKWFEVMKFMQANPHILLQLLSLQE